MRRFARELRTACPRLDILIHNAGAIHPGYRTDAAGIGLTYAGQVVALFLAHRDADAGADRGRHRPEHLLPWTREDTRARDLLWDRCARAAVITLRVSFGFDSDTGDRGSLTTQRLFVPASGG